jgi:hypothetical protein
MAGEEKQILKIDLDDKSFVEKLNSAIGKLEELGDADNFKGLVSMLGEATKWLGVLAAAGLAVKTAIDLTEEAETIRKINSQFEILSRNAGLAATELESRLVGAVDGLVDDTDVLKAANEAIVKLGSSANKMPEIFELATKQVRAFGGDVIERFNAMSNAIASGNTRALKAVGIVIDQDKALVDYAKSLGITVNALTDADKRQALLNEALLKGNQTLTNIKPLTDSASESFQRMTVSLDQIKEAFILAFDRVGGDSVRGAMKYLSQLAESFKITAIQTFGDDTSKAKIQTDALKLELQKLNEDLLKLEKREGLMAKILPEDVTAGAIEKVKAQIAAKNEELAASQLADAKRVELEQSTQSVLTEVSGLETAKRQEISSRFAQSLEQMRLTRITAEQDTATSIEAIDRLAAEQKKALLDELFAKEEQLRAQVQLGTMTQDQLEMQLVELQRTRAAEVSRIDQDLQNKRIKALENFAQVSRNTAEGFAAGFTAAAARASQNVGNFAVVGQQAFAAFQNNAASALMDLGSGSKNAAEAMKGFFLGALADIAQAQGTIMLANIYNPASVAAGAALLVLAGLLRSMAQSSKSGAGGGGIGAAAPITGAAAGGATTGVGASSIMSADETRPELTEAKKQRQVNVIVQGSYFETEQTRRQLLEMIRAETDATGFSYVQIPTGA